MTQNFPPEYVDGFNAGMEKTIECIALKLFDGNYEAFSLAFNSEKIKKELHENGFNAGLKAANAKVTEMIPEDRPLLFLKLSKAIDALEKGQ